MDEITDITWGNEPCVQCEEVHLSALPRSPRHGAPHRIHEYPLLRESDVESAPHRVSEKDILYRRSAAFVHLQKADLGQPSAFAVYVEKEGWFLLLVLQ